MTFDIQKAREMLANEGYLYLKYVRVGNTFIFANAMNISQPDHKNMIADGETPASAAYLKINKDGLSVEEWSSTLKIGPAIDDEDLLRELFGV